MRELKRVACIDDDEFIREIVLMSLCDVGGFEAETYAEGRAALDRIPAFNPDLILLDVMMPNMDGLAVLEKLKADNRVGKTPVIFMTARAQASELDAYREAGASATIIKPFDPVTLPDQLRAVFAQESD